MKKLLYMLTLVVVFFAACTAPAAETTSGGLPTPPSEAASTPSSTEVPTPSPAPEVTMSEKQLAALPLYEELLSYCKDYGDASAFFAIGDMLDAGEVTQTQYEAAAAFFPEITEFDEQTLALSKKSVENYRNIVNGRLETLGQAEQDEFFGMVCIMPQIGVVYVSAFDTAEKRARFKAVIDLIDAWCADPTDENRQLFEDAFWSQELTPGEIVILHYYIYYHQYRPESMQAGENIVDTVTYMEARGFFEYAEDAYDELIEMNNTPNSGKDWLPEA